MVYGSLVIGVRRESGYRWVRSICFRIPDLLNTPQARFPVDLGGEIIRATARRYPKAHDVDMTFLDPRGTDLVIKFTPEMVKNLHSENRWRGKDKADEDGCYVHHLPTHGPNIYSRTCFKRDPDAHPNMGGVVYPQWAIGFEKPFRDKVGIEYKDGVVVKVHGNSMDAEIMRDMLVGVNATLHERGCGFNPKYPRFKAYPAGYNAPGAMHFGTDASHPSPFLTRQVPPWVDPPPPLPPR